jgi:hypothetical protein
VAMTHRSADSRPHVGASFRSRRFAGSGAPLLC